MAKKEIRSITGELYWNYGKGYVTADTPRTQAAVGFLAGGPVKLGDCAISTSNRCASILVTSWDGKPLKESKHILITAVGRSRNTGMAYSRGGQRLLRSGQAAGDAGRYQRHDHAEPRRQVQCRGAFAEWVQDG